MLCYFIVSFIVSVVSFWFGAQYGIDSCSDDIENTTILKYIKRDILRNSNMSDEAKLHYLDVLTAQLKSINV